MRRRAVIVVAGLVAVIAAFAIVAHLSFVRAAVLRYALTTVQQQYGIRLTAARLDYNLAALSVGLADLRIAAAGSADDPFFTADYLSAALPRRALLGDVSFRNVTVTNGGVRIVRRADGTTNLPEASDRPTAEPAPLRIARIDAARFRIDILDQQNDLDLRIPAATIQLANDSGRIALIEPATLRAGDRRTQIYPLEGGAAFDGRALRLTGVQVESEELSARVDGALELIARDPEVNLTLVGRAEVGRLARWAPTEVDVAGDVAIGVRVGGPMADAHADVTLNTPRLSWQDLVVTAVSARAQITSEAARVDQLQFGIEGGRVLATGLIPFDADTDGRVSASWSGVEAAALTRALEPSTAVLPATTLAGDLNVSGPFSSLDALSGTARVQMSGGRTTRGRIGIDGAARVALSGREWRLAGRQRIGGTAPVTIDARGRLLEGPQTDSTISGTIHIAETALLPLFDALRVSNLATVPEGIVSSGVADADVRISGRLQDPVLDFTAAAKSLVVQSAGALGAAGELTAMGTYRARTEQYTASATGTGWQIAPTADLPLIGTLDARFMGSGTIARPRGEGDLVLRAGRWDDLALGDVTASVQLDGRTAVIDARAPEFNATANGRVQLDSPYASIVELRTDKLDLAPLFQRVDTPTPLRGTTTLAIHAEGPLESWRRGSAVLELATLDATAGDLPVRLAEPAHFRYSDDRLHIDRLEADVGETRLSASGELPVSDVPSAAPGDAAVLVTMSGDVNEMARAAAATGLTELPITGGDGPVALLARVTGSIETPVIAADLEVGPGSVVLRDFPKVSDVRLRAHAESGWLELRAANASYQGATMSATGKAPIALLTGQPAGPSDGDLELHARATGITPGVLEPFVDATTLEELAGVVEVTVDLSSPTLDVADATGELRLDRLEMRIADLPVTQQAPTRISVRDGIARIEAWDWTGQGATLGVRGQVRLSDRQAAILANGVIDLRMATPFVRDAGITTAGKLEPRLSITGALDDPRIDGDVTVSGGEVRLVDPRVLVSDLAARAVLTRTSARITTLTGMVNGGPLTGDGSVEYQTDGQLIAQLTTDIRGMALEFPPGLRSEINAALALALDRAPGQEVPSGRLSGTATIVRGAYREPLAVVTGLLTTLRTRRLAAAAEPSPFLDALALDVRLVTDEDIIVNNNYGRFQLGGDLRVIGTAAAPALSGRAELREGGQLFVGRNVYTVNFGTIDFANPVTIEPDLSVEATTRAGGEDIEVTIKGTPETIAVDLRSTSNPNLGQAEVASLLLTGRRLEDLDPTDAAFVGTQVLGNFSAEVLGFASRAIGLDTLRLGGVENAALRRDSTAIATETDPTTRLTFGKSLGRDVDVTFSQSLRDSAAQTWIVDYLPARRLDLRLVSGDDDLRSYAFRHDMTFGGGVARSGQPVAASRGDRMSRVLAVNITGDLALPEQRVRDVLKLAPGDRFDFGAWQADRDRIEDVYRRSGYLVARVMTTRNETEEGVTLTYQIASGPHTAISVTGMDLDGGLRSRLEAAWSNAFFDEFLVDEASRIVKDALAGTGYLRAMVTARVTGSETMRTLEVVVDRGPRTSETKVRIDATDPALADDINAFLSMRGLVNRAVLDPGSLEREATAHLRTKGYLRARVMADAPLFEDTVAIVPLTVDSGPLFTIATVRFDGARGLPIETVRETAGIMEGAPFDPAVPDAARERLVALHRREGFPTPAVMVQQTIRTGAPSVDLAFVIAEGPRQVVGEVVVAGNRAIDSDVIVRALGLKVNEPLRAAESLQGRARVFDTGLFRRVDISAEPLDASPQSPVAQTLSGLRNSSDARPMRLRVTVEEWPALRLRYGVQVAEERPEGRVEGRNLVPGLSADLTRRTLFGRAIGLGGALAAQRREQHGRLFLNAPTLAGWPIESSLVLERSREVFSAVTLVTQKQGVSWEQRLRVRGALSVSYAYRFERNHTFDTGPPRPELPRFDITINIARITPTVAWDTRDDPSDTTRGSLVSSSLEWAPESAGSDIRFVRELVQAYYFRPWRGTVFASAARFGVVQALGGQELILSERFFAGGSRTVRGVGEDSLGERDFFGDPRGGQALLVLNQEARVPIYKWVRAVGFVDAGNVFARAGDLTFGDLVGSIGVGLRVATPFALLRADYARAVAAGPLERRSGRFIFGIGHAF